MNTRPGRNRFLALAGFTVWTLSVTSALTIEVIQNAVGTSFGAAVFQATPVSILEPATITLLGIGLIVAGAFLRRQRPSSKR